MRKTSLGIGFLNVNGWSEATRKDVCDTANQQNLDVVCLAETKKRFEDRDKIKLEGFDVFEARRANVDEDKKGGGLAILTRQKDGIVFRRHNPAISDPKNTFIKNERMWITYDSKQGKTAVCCVYLGYQNNDDCNGEWNDSIFSVLATEVYDLRALGYRINIQGDFNCWIGCDLAEGGIPGNDIRVNKNGKRFLDFCAVNSLVHLNGAVRTPGDWATRISSGLWTRHAATYGSSTVLDYSLVSKEHMDSVLSFHVDQNGSMGGSSDHNFTITRLADHFVKVDRGARRNRKPGWNIREDQDWSEYRSVAEQEWKTAGGVDDGSAEFLADKLARVFKLSMEKAVGYRKQAAPKEEGKLPKAIVNLLHERKRLETAWKREKSIFADSKYSAQNCSVLVAAQALEDKKFEVEMALKRFYQQGRSKLLGLCKGKSKKAKSLFWQHVSYKSKVSTDISALQSKKTGILLCKPEEIAEEAYEYMSKIFGSAEQEVGHGDEGQVRGGVEGLGGFGRHGGDGGKEDLGGQDHGYAQQLPRGGLVDDHGYAVNPRPVLKSKDSSKDAGKDPAGFLDKDFSDKEVRSIVESLGNGKAAGWDNIPNEAIKEAPPSLLVQLRILFNRVKNKSEVPASWKQGRLVLVHKKGPKIDVNNYRLVGSFLDATVIFGNYSERYLG